MAVNLRLGDLSFRQISVAAVILWIVTWAGFQFVILPHLTQQERVGIYAGWMSTPYPYTISVSLILAAGWFAFSYRGRYATHERRILVFGMALGVIGGMLMILVLRASWHI
jgi:hypothetical protein